MTPEDSRIQRAAFRLGRAVGFTVGVARMATGNPFGALAVGIGVGLAVTWVMALLGASRTYIASVGPVVGGFVAVAVKASADRRSKGRR